MRYYLCLDRTDIRKGINPLCSVVHERMGYSVRNDDEVIFIGSNRKLMKLLHIEDVGLVMCIKCLEIDRLKVPSYDENSANSAIPLPNLLLPLICPLLPLYLWS